MQRARGRPLTVTMLLIVGALVWAAAPIALLVAATTQSQSIDLSPERPTWVPVEPASGELQRATEMSLRWSAEESIYAPDWGGLVQEVEGLSDGTWTSGEVVARVSGVQRVAWASVVPLYRSVGIDDNGSDVQVINEILRSRELRAGDGDRFTNETLAGTRAFAALVGIPEPTQVQAFEPGWIIYLPSENVSIASTTLSVGAPAPGPGQPIAKIRPFLSGALLTSPANAGETVWVSTSEVPVLEDGITVDASGLGALQAAVAPEADAVTAVIKRPASGEWSLPAASLRPVVGQEQYCVISRDSSGNERIVLVDVRGGADGASVVSGEFVDGDLVRVAISDSGAQCP